MNKHLKKIADEARFVDTIDYPDQDVIFEKFAELIIRECIDIAHANGDNIDYLTKQFGLKE